MVLTRECWLFLGAKQVMMNDAEIRVALLAYIQRGGVPNAHDRLVASMLGANVVDVQGAFVQTARNLGISFCD